MRASTETDAGSDREAQLALLLFAAVVVGAFPVLLALGHYRWFANDEWFLLVRIDGGDIRDLVQANNGHLCTLPFLVFRGLWQVVGLRSYVPYQALLVILHLSVAALLRMVMRRSGVRPWISTAAAVLFVFFGTGYQNIVWAIQINFVGSLVFGLLHLLLTDHDGAVDRRDWLGLCAGFLGLLCSGVAVTMTVVVGVAVLLRRGWRVALLHTAPLGLIFVVWWFTIARNDPFFNVSNTVSTPEAILRFLAISGVAAFDSIGKVPGIGVALAVVLLIGLALLWLPPACAEQRQRARAPTALLIGALVFLVIAGLGRASKFGPESARSSRYLHVAVALALPAVALSADAVARRWRWSGPIVMVLLVTGVPGNVESFLDARDREEATFRATRSLVLTLPRVPAAQRVPGWVRPFDLDEQASPVTVGWLNEGVASGRIPDPGPIDAQTKADLELRLDTAAYKQAIGRALTPEQRRALFRPKR